MKIKLSIAIIVFVIFCFGAAVYISKKYAMEQSNNTPAISFSQYSFDKIGIKFSVPSDMTVVGDDSLDDIFTMTVQRGKYPESNYYQLYGILQTTFAPVFDIEGLKKDLEEGAKNTVIGGAPAIYGRQKGERNNLVTFIFTNKGIFRLATTPSSVESEAITSSILDTLIFDFSGDLAASSSVVQTAVRDILAKKYNRPLSEVRITVKKEISGFSSGSVLFGQGGVGEGGVWLAVKAGENWQLVFDGNGSIDCGKMRQEYGFPDTILKPDFCNPEEFEAESAVRAHVAREAGVIEDLVIVVSTYKKNWLDGCFGLGGPAESCLAAVTPGYEITVAVNGEEQKYRTNVDGSEIRRGK